MTRATGTEETIAGGVRQPRPHDSARKHVSGEARYTDDIVAPSGCLEAYVAMSTRAHARVLDLNVAAVHTAPGVHAVLTAADIPGVNDVSPIAGDDPIFATKTVEYIGQPVFAVVAETVDQARAAARLATIRYEDLEPILTIDDALRARSFVIPSKTLKRGDARQAIDAAPHRLSGRIDIGGQDHFYLEGQIALAIPDEDNGLHITSSSQNPTEVQHCVARALGTPDSAITVAVRRMGGGFGGKETQPALIAAIAALGARRTGHAVKLRLDRDDDMAMTGKRHPFRIDYEVGFDDAGRITGIAFMHACNAGRSADLTGPVADRAVFHADNAYWLPNVTIVSHRCKTNTVSNTAFRGFGGPQGMVGIERVMDEIAAQLGKDPLDVRIANFYGVDEHNVTPYGMTVEDNVIHALVADLERSSDYRARRAAIRDFNRAHQWLKKGIALTPVKFGISFTATHYNQAGALVNIYTDGSVTLNHGGTEMGQGLFVKVAQVVAEELQIDLDRVRLTATHTGKVPNTSATAASSGSDLNGMAALAAAQTLRARLTAFAAERFQTTPDAVRWLPGRIQVGATEIAFAALVKEAYLSRVPLSATGFYATPKLGWDGERMWGRPFYYFSYGAAVTEVMIDVLTGENRVLRTDLLHDVGRSLNPAIDLGQIEGGYIQGVGWLTTEELCWDAKGALKTHAPSTYKIPTCGDRAPDFRMQIWARGENREEAIHRSKAVGEPPLMLGISALLALSDAVASVTDYQVYPDLDAPATPERLLMAVERVRQQSR